jgi:DNA polymerase
MSAKLARVTKPLSKGAVDTLLRGCFRAAPGKVFVVADWSQVEARYLCWSADDVDALRRFALFDAGDKINGDPYVASACSIYGGKPADYFGPDGQLTPDGKEKRQIGKSAELGCQYQIGGPGFERYAIKNGADWSKLKFTAADVVKAWRALHAPIVSFWYEMQDAAARVTRDGGTRECGPYVWGNVDGLTALRLPSGRLIAYQGMVAKWEPAPWGGPPRPQLKYTGREGVEHTFGGKLVENATQGACACLLREALIECERIDLPVVMTCHDEIVAEVEERDADDACEALHAIMCTVPDYAPGLPLAATGFICERYRKE